MRMGAYNTHEYAETHTSSSLKKTKSREIIPMGMIETHKSVITLILNSRKSDKFGKHCTIGCVRN